MMIEPESGIISPDVMNRRPICRRGALSSAKTVTARISPVATFCIKRGPE